MKFWLSALPFLDLIVTPRGESSSLSESIFSLPIMLLGILTAIVVIIAIIMIIRNLRKRK